MELAGMLVQSHMTGHEESHDHIHGDDPAYYWFT